MNANHTFPLAETGYRAEKADCISRRLLRGRDWRVIL